MEDKLEKLALTNKRLTSSYPDKETEKQTSIIDRISFYEAKDKEKNENLSFYNNNVPRITEFFEGKDILITGGTGFVGKVLIEKILRSLPKGGRIFLLLRGRKGLTFQQRTKAMLELPVFKLVMTENPKAAKRLVAIEGDCAALGLGLSQADRQTIIDNVSIVYHCAATVRFDLPFSFVALLNTRGTREIVNLCKELKKLDVFVHVSTAYTCATRDRTTPIPEEVLPAGIDWRTVITAAEKSITSSKSDGFDLIFEKLERRHTTNYTFCKLLAENLVEEECRGLPAIIVRPSVLVATYEDPFGGWLDNLYGPFSLWDATRRGIVRALYGDVEISLDLLPVDFHVKTLISAAWHRGLGYRMRSDLEKVDVVNNSTSSMVKKSLKQHFVIMRELFDIVSHKYIFRYPRFYMTRNFWVFWLITVTSHLPMGLLIDTILKLSGKKPLLLDVYRRLFFNKTRFLVYFMTRSFEFDDKWQCTLDARLPEEDKLRFSWATKYFGFACTTDTAAGVIEHVFKEKPVTGKQSNKQIMYIVDWVQNVLLVGLGLWLITWMIYR